MNQWVRKRFSLESNVFYNRPAMGVIYTLALTGIMGCLHRDTEPFVRPRALPTSLRLVLPLVAVLCRLWALSHGCCAGFLNPP